MCFFLGQLSPVYLHNNVAAFVNGAFGCVVVAAGIDGWVIAANAAKLCIFIGGNRPAAAAAAVVSADCVFKPTTSI